MACKYRVKRDYGRKAGRFGAGGHRLLDRPVTDSTHRTFKAAKAAAKRTADRKELPTYVEQSCTARGTRVQRVLYQCSVTYEKGVAAMTCRAVERYGPYKRKTRRRKRKR